MKGYRVKETDMMHSEKHERARLPSISVRIPLSIKQDGVVSSRCDELEGLLGCRHDASESELRHKH